MAYPYIGAKRYRLNPLYHYTRKWAQCAVHDVLGETIVYVAIFPQMPVDACFNS